MTAIAIVGEAWGEQEERARAPFVGAAGYELTRMLDEAGIRRADCFLTNVFNLRPERNDIESLCGGKNDSISGMPAVKNGKYIHSRYAGELVRLLDELSGVRPNVTIALGNTASWALLRNTGISKIRGTITATPTKFGDGPLKVLPTYHPAAVLRDWSLRPITVIDFKKAARESTFPDIRRPKCWVHVAETLDDLELFYVKHLEHAEYIAFDIETSGNQITCIGFSPSTEISLVVPFVDNRVTDEGRRGSYWRTLSDESAAWKFVRRVLSLPCPKFGQNTLYDIHFLWRGYGIPVVNYTDDTMLLHHALQPESPKGLGFLGSVYTDHSSWKTMRTKVLTISKEK